MRSILKAIPNDIFLTWRGFSSSGKRKLLTLSVSLFLILLLDFVSIFVLAFGVAKINFGSMENPYFQDLINLEFAGEFLESVTSFSAFIFLIFYIILITIRTFWSILVNKIFLNELAKESAILTRKLIKNIYTNNVSTFKSTKSQEKLLAVGVNTDSLIVGYFGSAFLLISDLLFGICVLGAFLFLNLKNTLLFLILISIVLFRFQMTINYRIFTKSVSVNETTSDFNQTVLDGFKIFRQILLAGKLEPHLDKLKKMKLEMSSLSASVTFLPNLQRILLEYFVLIGLIGFSLLTIKTNGIQQAISTFLILSAMLSRIMPAFLRIQGNLSSMRAFYGLSSFTRNMIAELNHADKPKRVNNLKVNGNIIHAENLYFRYENQSNFIISNLSFEIFEGEKVAITGPSGSGKSTCLDLILGFLIPASGSVKMMGLEPSTARMLLPGMIAFCPQESEIFDGTLAENISLDYGKNIDLLRVEECLKIVNFHSYAQELPNGIHTKMSDSDLKLSGGEKQRIGIARSIYSKPKVLILDEATSALDASAEQEVMVNLINRFEDCTIIIVSHRETTKLFASREIRLT